jgi:hypothetical protein
MRSIGRVGESDASQSSRVSAASDTPTRPSLRDVHPPHEGEGEP